MKILLLIVILFITTNVFAKEYRFHKKVLPSKLQTELKTAGFAVIYITGTNEDMTIVLEDTETKNPQAIIDAHVYIDLAAKLETNRARMLVLAKKWIAGTITLIEKDELIKRFIISSILADELD